LLLEIVVVATQVIRSRCEVIPNVGASGWLRA
jgi:hypothetical protein